MTDEELDDIEMIRALPHFRTVTCACGGSFDVHALEIYGRCPRCGTEIKCRSFGGIGTEIQDVIEAALAWAEIPRKDVIQRHRAAAAESKK